MKIGPVQSNLPVSLIEFCRMQRMISPGDAAVGANNGSSDAVELSPRAQWMSRLNELPHVRQERVQCVRTQLENGAYDTESKLDAALDRMIDELPVDDLGRRITNPRNL